MAAVRKKRLFKIASEINIGKDAILEFLAGKGFKVENKPSALLQPEMVEAVYEKFKKEILAAEKQREKIEKHKKTRRDISDAKGGTPAAPQLSELDKIKAKQTEALKHKLEETEKKAVIEEKVDEKTEPQEEVVEAPAPEEAKTEEKVVIDLEEIEKKDTRKRSKAKTTKKTAAKRKVKEETKEEKAEEVKTEKESAGEVEKVKKKTAGKKRVSKKEAEKAKETEVEKEKTEEITAAEEIKETKPEKILRKAKKGKQVNKTGKDKELIKEEEVETELDSEAEKAIGKKRRKRKTLVEVEVDVDDSVKLRGLTVVGKIELEKEEARKKKKAKKEEEEEKPAPKGRRAKRKKIKQKELEIVETPSRKVDKKKRKRKKSIREQISQEDVDKAIRETLAGMVSHAGGSSRSKLRKKKKEVREEKEQIISEELEKEAQTLKLTEYVTTNDLANMMKVTPNDIIVKCMQLGLMVTINQRLDKDTITVIADDYGFDVEFIDQKSIEIEDDIIDDETTLKSRSPIVTIMGHVDHGKTSLLDYIRHANVVAGEAGGITQHIASYRVELPDKKYITFLDTPGHEAFTAMRARGAQVTDIVVLVVAADDNVMPQTLEAISHAQAAHVPIIVAINKIDKPDAQPDRIKQQLADQNILVEDWGGKHQSVEISAKKGTNVDQLLEKILLEAEMLESKANPNRKAVGTVIESHVSKGVGTVATVIVQKGTLNVGDSFVAGIFSGKVRTMMDERGNKVDSAGPSIPVGVTGFEGIPEAGDTLTVMDSEVEARGIATEKQQLRREQVFRQVRQVTLDDISKQIQIGGVKDLHLVIKGDVGGSVEALSDSLLKLSRDEVRVVILHKGVGTIKESDVMLAAASQAIIIGFNVGTTAQARKIADKEAIEIRFYDIIYNCINEVHLALEGLLSPDLEEEITSTVEIRKVFKISKLGNVAGCYVTSGKINRNDKVRVLREGLNIYEGRIHSLKRNKDDVKEVSEGYECGIQLENFNDIKPDDVIEGFKIIEIKRKLD